MVLKRLACKKIAATIVYDIHTLFSAEMKAIMKASDTVTYLGNEYSLRPGFSSGYGPVPCFLNNLFTEIDFCYQDWSLALHPTFIGLL